MTKVNLPSSVATVTQVASVSSLIVHAGIEHIDAQGNSYVFNSPPGTMWTQGFADVAANLLGARTRRNISYSGAHASWSDTNAGIHGGWSWILQNIRVPGMPSVNAARGWPYLPTSKLVIMEDTINDLAALGAGNPTPYLHGHRTALAARSLAAIWLAAGADSTYGTALDSAITLATSSNWILIQGGGEQTATIATKNTHSNAGGGYRYTSTVGSTITFTTPTDADEARVYDVCLPVAQVDNYALTVKVGSTTYAAYTVSGATICDPDTSASGAASVLNGLTLRLGSGGPTDPTIGVSIPAGTQIVVTLTTLTAGTLKFSHIGMESNPLDGPLLVSLTPNRMPSTVTYAFWTVANGFPHGSTASTFPMNDSNTLTWITSQQIMEIAEFPTRVISVNADMALAQNPLCWNDGGASGVNINPHPNPRGNRVLGIAIKNAILASPLLTDRVRAAAVISDRDFFLGIGYVGETAYANSWTDSIFAGLFATQPGAITIDLTGRVRVRGILNGASATAATIFTLPIDMRPPGSSEVIYAPCRISTTSGGQFSGWLAINSGNGAVQIDTPTSGVVGVSGCTVAFDFEFDAEH